jgi:hypothetical protein
VVPVAGNHEGQQKKPVKMAFAVNENAWRANMGDLILDDARFLDLFGAAPGNEQAGDNRASAPGDGPGGVMLTTDQSKLTYSFDFQGCHFVVINTDPVGNDSTGPNGHRFSNLIGSADNVPEDVGHLNVTFHHDWWADNVNQRMPRTRNGKIHVVNNLYTSVGDSYCTNAGFQASLLVENNVYSGVKKPLSPDANGDMLARNNLFTQTTGTTTATGMGFTPPYAYTPEDTTALEAAIRAGAGPH